MNQRRSIASSVGELVDPESDIVREFVTQATPVARDYPYSRETSKSKPMGMVAITVRLRPEIANGLKRASLERQLSGAKLYTQQDLIASILEPWLKGEGVL